MVDEKTIEWARSQISAGYTSDEVKKYLLGYGYDVTSIEKIIENAKIDESKKYDETENHKIIATTENRKKKIVNLRFILILTGVIITGIAIFYMTQETISFEPIDPYWCHDSGSDACEQEYVYENGFVENGHVLQPGIKQMTGYDFKSYFKAEQNRMAMDKYETCTLAIIMTNVAATEFEGLTMLSATSDNKISDEFYNEVIRKTNFRPEKLNPDLKKETIISILDATNEYFSNAKNFMNNRNEYTYSDGGRFKDNNEHMKFIETKIRMNEGLKERLEHLDIDERMKNEDDKSENNELFDTTILKFKSFMNMMTTNIKIVDYTQEYINEDEIRIIITLENDGIYPKEKEEYNQFHIYADNKPTEDVVCDFDKLDIDERGTCTGTISWDIDEMKAVKFSWDYYTTEYLVDD